MNGCSQKYYIPDSYFGIFVNISGLDGPIYKLGESYCCQEYIVIVVRKCFLSLGLMTKLQPWRWRGRAVKPHGLSGWGDGVDWVLATACPVATMAYWTLPHSVRNLCLQMQAEMATGR